nr:RidA family protein [uncultured Carboxylicivirga sp.]
MFGNEIKRKYKIILSSDEGDIQNEWDNCIHQLQSIKTGRIFKISIFVDSLDWEYSFKHLSTQLKEVFADSCPTFTFLSQAPGQHKVAFEVGIIENDDVQINYKWFQQTPYTIIEYSGYKELWASALGLTSKVTDISSSAANAFENMLAVLRAEAFNMNEVVRQWNYIPHILDFETKDDKEWQHYQLFNEVRRHYYNTYRTTEGYPAATGIGTSAGSVSIDICAYKSKEQNTYSVNNPEQVNAYQYQQDVLVGELIEGTKTKQAPQFERAKLIHSNQVNTLFISGTASIKGQYTIGLNNPEEQTNNTLKLIQKLAQTALPISQKSNDSYFCFSYARIYIKDKANFDLIESICKTELPNVPLNFVQADVCRDNLLVEVEAEMHLTTEENKLLNTVDNTAYTHC